MTEHNQWTATTPLIEAVRIALLEQQNSAIEQLSKACSADRQTAAEGVHDARVALRRSIALLDQAAPWMEKKWVCGRRKKNQSFLRLLGRVRDADILVLQAERFFAGQDSEAVLALLTQLRESRNLKHARLCRKLNSKEQLQKLGGEIAILTDADATLRMLPVPVSDRGSVRLYRLGDCLPAMLWCAVSRLTVFQSVIPGSAGEADTLRIVSENILHRLRLAAKDLRYVIAFAAPLLGESTDTLLAEFKELQTILGDWHDTVIARQAIKKLKTTPETTDVVRPWLIERQAEGDRLQCAFNQLWAQMTPQWFHRHLTDGLSRFYALKENETGCSGCQA